MRTIDGIGNWALILMALASLVSMIAAFQLDLIVHVDLYSYGLQFSDAWAYPYWTAIRLIFAMSWLSLIAAIAFQIYKTIVMRKLTSEMQGELDVTISSNSKDSITEEDKKIKTSIPNK
ncbi:MAG: hypothetical protein ACXACB_01875 [Promethearchaeota archaeon]|jgi:hypothetical protein